MKKLATATKMVQKLACRNGSKGADKRRASKMVRAAGKAACADRG